MPRFGPKGDFPKFWNWAALLSSINALFRRSGFQTLPAAEMSGTHRKAAHWTMSKKDQLTEKTLHPKVIKLLPPPPPPPPSATTKEKRLKARNAWQD
jgi:hypothetical protein